MNIECDIFMGGVCGGYANLTLIFWIQNDFHSFVVWYLRFRAFFSCHVVLILRPRKSVFVVINSFVWLEPFLYFVVLLCLVEVSSQTSL